MHTSPKADAARQAFGVFKDALDRVISKEGTRGVAGDAYLVFDVANRLLQVERSQVAFNREALVERFMDG